ncbi:MAG: nitroreductase family protein [Deltaproteobacteria bacterium]|nr:nitroreductase family protein [Deltaproteobacteria bacterium]
MNLRDLIVKNRSYRRFHEDVPIAEETLRELVDLARLSASAANRQPLRYLLSSHPKMNALIFPNLAWAAYLRDWPGPSEGERPAAYIIVLRDNIIGDPGHCDHGIAAQSILLGAAEKGLGGCIIASVKRKNLAKLFGIPEKLEILFVIALGKPRERVVIETVDDPGDIRYWRDSDGVHHVPKRSLEDIIIG